MTIIHFITTDRDIHLGETIRSLRNFKSCLDRQQLLRKTWRKDTDLSESTPDTVDFPLKRCKFTGRKGSHTDLNLNHRVIFLIFILSFVLMYQSIPVKISHMNSSERIFRSTNSLLTIFIHFYLDHLSCVVEVFFLEKYAFLECMHVIHIDEQYGAGNKLYWISQTSTLCVFKL